MKRVPTLQLKSVEGVEEILSNIHRHRIRTAHQVEMGLKKAGLFLQRESQKIVPVDTGNLRASATTRKVSGSGFSTDVVVAYGQGAEYAVYVHEDLNAHHAPGKQAKYLEEPSRTKRREILALIRGFA